MKYYLEITLIDTASIKHYELWAKVYSQLHLALVEMQDAQGKVPVGVSFPEYRYQESTGGYLGSKLRVFAPNETTLQNLNLAQWLSRLADYIHYTGIREVPIGKIAGYSLYSRLHIKGSIDNLARRYAKRHAISLEQARKQYQEKSYNTNLPYIQLKSLTTKQAFHLFIAKQASKELVQNKFGTYGLDSLSTVPEF